MKHVTTSCDGRGGTHTADLDINTRLGPVVDETTLPFAVDSTDGERAVALHAITNVDGLAATPMLKHHPFIGHQRITPPRWQRTNVAVAVLCDGMIPTLDPQRPNRGRPYDIWPAVRRFAWIDSFDEIRGRVTGQEGWIAQGCRQEITIRYDATHMQTFERQSQPAGRFSSSWPVRDHLGQHGIEVHTHDGSLLDTRVPSHYWVGGRSERFDRADRRQEAVVGVLGVQPGLYGMTGKRHVVLRVTQRLATSDTELLAHQVDAGHFFGDRVLDLQSGVDFKEEELATLVVDQELDSSGRLISHCSAKCERGVAHGSAHIGIDNWRRGLFDDLLMATLDRAVALT